MAAGSSTTGLVRLSSLSVAQVLVSGRASAQVVDRRTCKAWRDSPAGCLDVFVNALRVRRPRGIQMAMTGGGAKCKARIGPGDSTVAFPGQHT